MKRGRGSRPCSNVLPPIVFVPARIDVEGYIYIYMHTPVCKQELQNHECARSAERGTVNSFLEDKEPLEQG